MDEVKEIERLRNGLAILPLLARLVEAYECGPNRVEYILRFRHLLSRRNALPQKGVSHKLNKALDSSGTSALNEMFGKTLHSPSKYLREYERLLDDWHQRNASLLEDELTEDEVTSWEGDYELADEERERRGDLFDNLHATFEKESEDLKRNPELKRAFAREMGVAEDIDAFDLVVRRYQGSHSDSETSYFADISRPKAGLLWSKELIGRIEEIVEREQKLLSHPVASLGASIPKSIGVLFEQSHLCFLFNLELPCIISCGALLEEAVENRFPELSAKWFRQWKKERVSASFRKKIEEVVSAHPWAAQISSPALRIYEVRNEAVHAPAKYLGSGKGEPTEILRDTREVLHILYETKGIQERRN